MTNLDLAKIKEAADAHTIEPKRTCTCYPDADRPFPCPEKFAARDCYEAALIARLEAAEARNATAYAEGVEAAAAIHTAEVARLEKQIEENIEYTRRVGRSDHSANNHCHEKLRQHLYYAEAIRALLKDKPNG